MSRSGKRVAPIIRDRIVDFRRVPEAEVRKNPRNWRVHPPAQRAALHAILVSIGYADALLARETPDGLELLNGHLRKELTPGQLLPVLIVDLNDEEADLLLATLDPITGMATADADALTALLAGVDTDQPALRDLLTDLAEQTVTPPTWADRADSLPELGAPVTEFGDVWQLGDHRLRCGDATDEADVTRLMDRRRAVLFATDPPYLVDYDGADRPSHGKDWSELYHEVDIKDAEAFLRAVFTNAMRFLTPDAAWYCWHAHKRASLIERIWSELGVINHQQLIWCKPSIVHGYSFYPWQHEPCLMGWRKGHKPRHDGENTAATSSVWHVDWEGRARVVGNEHPTQKPVELFCIPIRKHTRPGAIVFEPFCGSGTQILAAEATGRVCYALEIEPRFCDLAVRRWEEATGKTAVRISRGSA